MSIIRHMSEYIDLAPIYFVMCSFILNLRARYLAAILNLNEMATVEITKLA